MEVVALKKHRHGNKIYKAGDKYLINDKTTLTLYKALGWVSVLSDELKPLEVRQEKPVINKPAPIIAETNKTNKSKHKKGTYQRKDLVAEPIKTIPHISNAEFVGVDLAMEEPVVKNEFDAQEEEQEEGGEK
jgi:hypothetical protein